MKSLKPKYLALALSAGAFILNVILFIIFILSNKLSFSLKLILIVFGFIFIELIFLVIARYLVELFVYKKIRYLNNRLRIILKRRNNQEINMSDDIISGLENNISRLSESITKEIKEMRDMDLFRKEYIAVVSHELKTPIFAIEGFLETLMDGALEDENVNRIFIEKALKNTHRLNNIVQDLITITRLESGELKMRIESFRIYDLILDVFDLLDPLRISNGRNVTLIIKGNDLENQFVLADKERINQVLFNLIGNAIFYGKPNGTTTVELVDHGDKIQVKIIDDGPGIEPEHLSHLFERFYRIERSRSREKGGTGLGLAIVKNLLDAHNEEITVFSQRGIGTIFTFTLTKDN